MHLVSQSTHTKQFSHFCINPTINKSECRAKDFEFQLPENNFHVDIIDNTLKQMEWSKCGRGG